MEGWKASDKLPVKVINYLLVAYIDPPISLDELRDIGVVNGHPRQSIYELRHDLLTELVARSNLVFDV